MSKEFNITVLPGDGIGPEVIAEAIKVLRIVERKLGLSLKLEECPVGGAAYELEGHPLPENTLKKAESADAVLLGAVGGPKWETIDFSLRPERALLGLRSSLGLFANLRPAKIFRALTNASSLKPEVVEGLDIMVVRELTGGIYFGEPRGIETTSSGERKGVNTLVYTESEIRRIAAIAFDVAKKRDKKVCSIDKANVLECTGLWRDVVTEAHKDHPEIELIRRDGHHQHVWRYPE
jgi:3-isopropylmalate dehydrogenase